MNTAQILTKILDIAEFPEEDKKEFVDTFYFFLLSKFVDELSGDYPEDAEKISQILADPNSNLSQTQKIIKEITDKPEIKKIGEKVQNEVIAGLVDTIATTSTDEQKKKILSILPV